ncbi:hypothetical protein AB0393_24570 [Streptomyces cyaneofuscatus]|uniref:hypothetical protein n=1 Tax=Streptomyces TaxID=1883 RepID=UPI00344B1B24
MTDTDSSQTSVTRWDVSVGDLPGKVVAAAESSRLFLLPDKTIDGVDLYQDDVVGLVKTLRHHGVDIDFASPREDRRYLSEFGATDVVAVIAIAVAGNLTGDLLKSVALTVWHRACSALGASSAREQAGSANVTVRIAEIQRNNRETVVRGLEVTGQVADVEALIRDAISDRQPTQLPPGLPDADESDTAAE